MLKKEKANQDQRAQDKVTSKPTMKLVKTAFIWVVKVGIWLNRLSDLEEWLQNLFSGGN